MKKLIALLLNVAMLIGMMSAALAYDEEITWQGLPWESSAEEVVQFLLDNEIISAESEFRLFDSGIEYFSFITNKGKESKFKKDYTREEWLNATIGSYIDPESMQIGGYNVRQVFFHFVRDGESEKLISIVIQFDSNSFDKKDMKNKINSVYGKKWIGANNTAVLLVEQGIWGYNYLIYSRTDAAKMIKEAFKHVPAEPTVDPNNTNGI